MFNGSDFVKAWLRISWLLLLSGLLVLGLSVWFHWPTVIALIAMIAVDLGILMKITSPLLVRVEGQREPWHLIIPVLVVLTMIFGISPVLLALAYVSRSTALLWAAGIVAGIGVVAFIVIGGIGSQIEGIRALVRVVIPRRTHTRLTQPSERTWSRVGWLLLVLGLLVLGLGVWFSWPTIVTLIAMIVGSLGLLVRILLYLSLQIKKRLPWYMVAPSLVVMVVLLGVSPVLLTLAYVFGSPALLRAAGMVAGIGVVAFLIASWILAQVGETKNKAEMAIPRHAHTRSTESSEEDHIPLN